jgi:hypothetical protein
MRKHRSRLGGIIRRLWRGGERKLFFRMIYERHNTKIQLFQSNSPTMSELAKRIGVYGISTLFRNTLGSSDLSQCRGSGILFLG